MPLNSVHQVIKNILNGLQIPGGAGMNGTLACYITPPAERNDPSPAIYIYASRGQEHRESLPRAKGPSQPAGQSGWKQIEHTIDGYLTWFDDNFDPAVDTNFIGVVDAVMQALRSALDPLYYYTDALTGQQSEIYAIGEKMTYELAPPRATTQERMLRFDALITVHCWESFQA
jgi:hypothetical protein